MGWVDALGWIGALALVTSRLQVNLLRYRLLYVLACVLLLSYTLIRGIWPLVAATVVLTGRAVLRVNELRRDRNADRCVVLEVGAQDDYLRHLLRVYGPDIQRHRPDFVWDGAVANRYAVLMQLHAETVGIVLFHDVASGIAEVDLDYVTPRHRHLQPGVRLLEGRFFADRGYHRVMLPTTWSTGSARLRLRREQDRYVCDLPGS